MKGLVFLMVIFLAGNAHAQTKPTKLAVTEALGDTLLNREDFSGALKQYNKVAKTTKLKDADARQILYKRALCYFYLEQFDRAVADLNIFIPENPNFIRARLLRAFLYRELGDLEPQLEDLNEVLEWDAFNVDLLKWRAALLVELSKNREAVDELKKIKLWGTDEQLELYLGLAYYGLGDADSALIHFDEAIALNGGYLPAYLYAGMLSLEQGAFALALSYIDLALMLDAGNVQLLFYKGVALIELNRKDEGCQLLNRAFYGGIDEAGDYLVEHCYPKDE
jgi:tetratricopeptide (TPR) repeat protein